ncbi:hypothetical protein J6590_010247 [Homalodisca vitripennis]|nr:hypothetical protein J6590_010247 [Homalodisca vitripennis]
MTKYINKHYVFTAIKRQTSVGSPAVNWSAFNETGGLGNGWMSGNKTRQKEKVAHAQGASGEGIGGRGNDHEGEVCQCARVPRLEKTLRPCLPCHPRLMELMDRHNLATAAVTARPRAVYSIDQILGNNRQIEGTSYVINNLKILNLFRVVA